MCKNELFKGTKNKLNAKFRDENNSLTNKICLELENEGLFFIVNKWVRIILLRLGIYPWQRLFYDF